MPGTIFDESYSLSIIHPAIDLLGNKFYFGIVMPYEMEDGEIIEILHFINDAGECFPAFEDELASRGLKLRFPDAYPERRWRLDKIKAYIESKVCRSDGTQDAQDTPNSAQCFSMLKEAARKYIYFYEELYYDLISLWIIGTYLQPIWDTYPYLDITGFMRSGKTTLCRFIEVTAFNSILSASITAPALFRVVQSCKSTLIIDEAEKLTNPERAREIRDLLLTGYKQAGYAVRTEKTSKEKMVPRRFNTFCPKAIVSVSGLEEYLADRSIPIVMIRTNDPQITTKVIRDKDPQWADIRDACYRFALDNWGKVKQIYDEIQLPGITARDYEVWKPILTLAKFFGVFEKMYDFALRTIKEKETENLLENRDMILLKVLLEMVKEDGYYSVSDIKARMKEEFDEEPKWLTNDWIGRALSNRLKFKEKRRTGRKSIEYRLDPESVCRVASQYGIKVCQSDGTQDAQDTPIGIITEILQWLIRHRDGDGLVSSTELSTFIKDKLKIEPEKAISKLQEMGILQQSPKLDKYIVNL